jgi:transposase
MRRALWRIWDKKKNMIRDAHRKYALHMSRKFSVLLIPRFLPQSMVRKSKKDDTERVRRRDIGKGTVKAMLNWAHYSQHQRLLQLADRTEGFTVIEVVEPWTSRTCSSCGYLARKTSSKVFQCGQDACRMSCDRDLNAAKNILLR